MRATLPGSLQKKGKGGWYYAYFRYRRPDGTWATKAVALHTQDEEEAKRRLRELDPASILGVSPDSKPADGDPTLRDWIEQWLTAKETRGRRPRTLQQYRYLVRLYILPPLGDLSLRQVSPEVVRRWQARLATLPRSDGKEGHLSARTRELIQTILRSALQEAVRVGILSSNPVDAVERPQPEPYPARALTSEEVRRLLDVAKGTRLYPLWLLAVTTGMRLGEMLGLTWEDVDWERREVRVRRAKAVRGRPVARVVPLAGEAIRALTMERARQERVGLYRAGGPIIVTSAGTPWSQRNVQRAWARLRQQAGLGHVRIHDLRHTAATLMLAGGVPVKAVQEILGHSSEAFLLRRYAHVLPSSRHEAATAMDTLLRGNDVVTSAQWSVSTTRFLRRAKISLRQGKKSGNPTATRVSGHSNG
jgi:integrase